jgi:hypothetical protein
MKSYKGVKIPKNTGRPQLWLRGTTRLGEAHNTVRVVYPNGLVEYCYAVDPYMSLENYFFKRGCTTRETFEEAIKATIDYDEYTDKPIFVGYL